MGVPKQPQTRSHRVSITTPRVNENIQVSEKTMNYKLMMIQAFVVLMLVTATFQKDQENHRSVGEIRGTNLERFKALVRKRKDALAVDKEWGRARQANWWTDWMEKIGETGTGPM